MKFKFIIKHLLLTLILLVSLVSCKKELDEIPEERIMVHNVSIPRGFDLEILYHPNNHDQGSWVSVTKDDQGRLYTSDQFGHLYRVTLPNAENKLDSVLVKKLEMNIGQAQGLLWHKEALYAMVNADIERDLKIRSGLYKLTDSDTDGEFDKVDTLRLFKGWFGEHGPHNIELSPDKKSMYVVAGNHVEVPSDMESNVPRRWDEDNLIPIIKDPSGHANSIKAPGGWVAKVDIETEKWTLHSVGTRNTYDIAFNQDGELFGFDSDMEYDIGMPWYRPIRLCHFTSGAEFGWRTGTGKFIAEYPDNLPGIANLGQGSPTGLISTEGLKFPDKYTNGLFLFDWSYGTMYFANLKPKGSSYEAKIEEFLSGIPLPLTNGIAGDDGALYFLTGGRRLESALYKLTYTGKTSLSEIKLVENKNGKEERAFRHRIETFHAKKSPGDINFILENLDHSDRFTRFSARIALENQDFELWKDKIGESSSLSKTVALSLSMARIGDDEDRLNALNKLISLDPSSMGKFELIDYIRAIDLILIRNQVKLSDNLKNEILDILSPIYLKNTALVDRELGKTLSFLQQPNIIQPTLDRMQNDSVSEELRSIYISNDISKRSEQYGVDVENMLANMPNAQHISYAKSLSVLKMGWTTELRTSYFTWLNQARKKSGGRSYAKFIRSIQERALINVPKEERSYFESLANQDIDATTNWMEGVEPATGPGQNWTVADVKSAFEKNSTQANFKNGQNLYKASLCINCHTMNGVGGTTGPDLTQVASRFTINDMAEAIAKPSSTISDRYQYTQYKLKGNRTVVGRMVAETEDEIELSTSGFSPGITTKIKKKNIEEQMRSTNSPMPAGLINLLNEKELSDLIAYLLSGGDESHETYKK